MTDIDLTDMAADRDGLPTAARLPGQPMRAPDRGPPW